jgi:hypothetical protein
MSQFIAAKPIELCKLDQSILDQRVKLWSTACQVHAGDGFSFISPHPR